MVGARQLQPGFMRALWRSMTALRRVLVNLLSMHEPIRGVGTACSGTGAFQSVGGMTAPPRTGGPPSTGSLLVGGVWR